MFNWLSTCTSCENFHVIEFLLGLFPEDLQDEPFVEFLEVWGFGDHRKDIAVRNNENHAPPLQPGRVKLVRQTQNLNYVVQCEHVHQRNLADVFQLQDSSLEEEKNGGHIIIMLNETRKIELEYN